MEGWLKDALERIKRNRPRPVICDTPELAKEHGVTPGTAIMQYAPLGEIPSAQQMLAEHLAWELIRRGLIEMPE
jgi:hypothetical protein